MLNYERGSEWGGWHEFGIFITNTIVFFRMKLHYNEKMA